MAVLFFRTIILFLSLIVLMRILGKRQMGELELSELVVSVLIADLAASPLQDVGIPLVNALVPIVILFCCELILAGLTMKSVRLRALLCGKPCMLIYHGQVQQKEMRRCRFTIDELTEELRSRDILDIRTVEFAILETDGSLSAFLYPEAQPASAGQLGLRSSDSGYPVIVVDEGHLLSRNLHRLGRDEVWLQKRLRERGIASPEALYLMIVYENGEIYYVEKEAER